MSAEHNVACVSRLVAGSLCNCGAAEPIDRVRVFRQAGATILMIPPHLSDVFGHVLRNYKFADLSDEAKTALAEAGSGFLHAYSDYYRENYLEKP